MKMKQKLVAGAAVLSALAGFIAPAAHADVAATVGASNMYYWRGFDLGGGSAISADVKYSESGFYAGAWTSSGDGTNGTEYDLYSGYGLTAGDFKADLSVVSYNYPSAAEPLAPGDYTEAVLALGYGPVTATYYKSISAKQGALSDNSYAYATLAVVLDKFSLKYGIHMSDFTDDVVDEDDEIISKSMDGVAHLDLSYAYNDKLSFTIGKVIENNKAESQPDEANFVVNLSLPIE